MTKLIRDNLTEKFVSSRKGMGMRLQTVLNTRLINKNVKFLHRV